MLRSLEELGRRLRQRSWDNRRAAAQHYEEEIFHALRVAIGTGLLSKGEMLPAERRIVATTGASRRTVRRVMARLRHEGHIGRHVGRGTVVLRDTPCAVETTPGPVAAMVSGTELLEARLVIEPRIGSLAAERATARDIERMRHHIRAMRHAPDQVEFKRASYLFHLEMARATRNPLVVAMYEWLVVVRERMGWGELSELNDTAALRKKQVREQAEILDSIAKRDKSRAYALHLEFLSENLEDAAWFRRKRLTGGPTDCPPPSRRVSGSGPAPGRD